MTIKERLKRITAWIILDGPRVLTLGIFAASAVAAFGGLIWGLITSPLEVFSAFLFWAVVFGGFMMIAWIRDRIGTVKTTVIDWAQNVRAKSPESKPEPQKIIWSGTAPDDEWYVVSASGSARSGPTNLPHARALRDSLEKQWGPCELKHKSEFPPDPILEDLKRLNG